MTRPLYEPTPTRQQTKNAWGVRDVKRQPLAFGWWMPDCDPGDQAQFPGCSGLEPPLVNDWAQPSAPLETFAFRLHADGSLEFRGHLDTSQGAVSGTVAVTLPGANDGEADFRPAHDQYWHTTITTDDGVTFFLALVFIDSTSGDVTITWPHS